MSEKSGNVADTKVTTVKRTVQRITDNKELVAINRITRILGALTADERQRVMGYIGDTVRAELQREYVKQMELERQQNTGTYPADQNAVQSIGHSAPTRFGGN